MEENERIAVLETKVDTHSTSLKEILKKLDHLEETMTKYKGFLGGIMFVGSCLWAFLGLGKEWFLKKLGL